MGDILYYLTCCGCCGLLCQKGYVRKDRREEKYRTLKKLEEISRTEGRTFRTSLKTDPRTSDFDELTDIMKVPERYPTENEAIRSNGYELKEIIDSGSFANVYKAIHLSTKQLVACKTLLLRQTPDKKKFRIQDIKTELYVLETTKHPHIVKVVKHFIIEDSTTGSPLRTLYVFMQYASRGNLFTLSRKTGSFNETQCKIFFAQILNAMVYMHGKRIAHRDLKLQNLLLDDNDDILVSDFGLSRVAVRASSDGIVESNTYCGTPPFMSPEILERKGGYDAMAADVWAMGVILYRLFNGSNPYSWPKNRVRRAIKQMKACQWTYGSHIIHKPSQQLTDILTILLEPNPKTRPKVFQLTKHVWIKDEYKNVDQKARKLDKAINP